MIENVSPTEAWNQLKKDKEAVMVDVRTPEEWSLVGEPDLSSIGHILRKISWQNLQGQRNAHFIDDLKKLILDKNQPIYFLCRSGVRSLSASQAAMQAGFTKVYNVKGGFEGGQNHENHRGYVEGWKAEHLPWVQP